MSQRTCEDQVALVTGASQGGTGTAVAIRLAAEGARVAITARTIAGLEETRGRIEAIGGERLVVPVDLADPQAAARNWLTAFRNRARTGGHPRQQRCGQWLRPLRRSHTPGCRAMPPSQPVGTVGTDEGRGTRHARAWAWVDPQPHIVRRRSAAGSAIPDEQARHCRFPVRRDQGRGQPTHRRRRE